MQTGYVSITPLRLDTDLSFSETQIPSKWDISHLLCTFHLPRVYKIKFKIEVRQSVQCGCCECQKLFSDWLATSGHPKNPASEKINTYQPEKKNQMHLITHMQQQYCTTRTLTQTNSCRTQFLDTLSFFIKYSGLKLPWDFCAYLNCLKDQTMNLQNVRYSKGNLVFFFANRSITPLRWDTDHSFCQTQIPSISDISHFFHDVHNFEKDLLPEVMHSIRFEKTFYAT